MTIANQTLQVNFENNKLEVSASNLADYGFSEGDDLVATVIDGVVMVGTREVIVKKILTAFKEGFEEDGIALEELEAEGEKIRQELYEERFKNIIES